MLRIHLLQQWFALSDPGDGIGVARDSAVRLRRFAQLGASDTVPDETTIPNFGCSLKTYSLAMRMLEAVSAHLIRARA